MTLWKRLLCLSTVALCTVFVASAQENAELTGTVKDPSGAVVPNAKVTLTNASTAEVRAGTTNGAGLYDFPALHNGTYSLKVAATGFEAYAKTGIVMDVAATVREDVVLALGASTTTVTVQANALHLQTETNEVSNLITGEQLTQLGTNGRSMISLATLGMGVSANIPSFNGVSAQGSSESISFNGTRPGPQQLADRWRRSVRPGQRRAAWSDAVTGCAGGIPDAGQQLPAGLWNRLGRDHGDGSEGGHEEPAWRSVGI